MVGGSHPSEGRVELFYEGEWGRVVNAPPGVADVACQQAGYPYSEGFQLFEQGNGTVWIVIFVCTGDEERVEQCLHFGWRNIFLIPSDLGVRCRGKCGITHTL